MPILNDSDSNFEVARPKPSNLESNRVDELSTILEGLTHKVIEYVKKADSPDLGTVGTPQTPEELKTLFSIPESGDGQGIQDLFKQADKVLEHSVVTWNRGFLDKLYASTNPVGVASDLLLSILNTNTHVFTVSPALTIIEKKTAHEYAKMFGFNGQHSGGLTFPGGSYSNSTSLTTARNKLYPSAKVEGNGDYKFVVFASTHAHYSVEKAAIFCGLGSKAVIRVDVTKDGQMIPEDLESKIVQAKQEGYTPLYINATAGTTVYGSFDDFNAIADIAEKYGLWMHIDGSWGGNVVFSEKYRYKLDGSHRANSITVNPHKALGVPTTCSFLLFPNQQVLTEANSLNAPYLFHNSSSDEESYDLADGTMGCGRRPDALKLYLSWRYYGTKGYAERIDHAMEVTKYFATCIKNRSNFVLVSSYPPPFLQTCFYYTLKSNSRELFKDPAQNTKVTRRIATELHKRGKFLVDFAPENGKDGRGEFFRAVVNSPW